jgi:hypothetical protein
MNALVKPVEEALLPIFKGMPSLPESGRKVLVKIWPILALVFGVLQILAAWSLWNIGHTSNELVNYANQLSIATGGGSIAPELGVFYYLGLAVVVVDAVILLMAVAPLRAHQKKGWDLLFLGAELNLLYGLVILFDSYYGGFSSLLSTLIGSAIGFYLLFQVRDYYTGAKSATETPQKPVTTPSGEKPEQKV